MRIKIQILFYFITIFICNAQDNNISELFENCKNYSVKDSISIFDKYNNFTLRLPKKWNGEFKGDMPSLFAYKALDSSKIWLRGHTSYNVLDDNNKIKKNDPNFVGINFIESQEVLIIEFPKTDNERSIHGYEFNYKNEKTGWVWKFYLSTYKENLTSNDICEIKYIIKQFIHKYKN